MCCPFLFDVFWVDTVLVTAFPFPVHKDLAVVDWVIIAVKITAPSQTSFAVGVANDVFDFDATTATSLIFSFLRR
jgi:hypothetical protein